MGDWAVAYGVTLAVEVPVYVLVLATLVGVGWRRAGIAALVVNAVTHPLVWIALHPDLGGGGRYAAVVLAVEGCVVVAEGAMLRLHVGRETVLIGATALVANAASVLVGVTLLG